MNSRPLFGSFENCPACGYPYIGASFVKACDAPGEDLSYLWRKCFRCGYAWEEMPLYTQKDEKTITLHLDEIDTTPIYTTGEIKVTPLYSPWIPVDTALPYPYRYVIARWQHKTSKIDVHALESRYCQIIGWESKDIKRNEIHGWHVTHWMPMPPIPEEENEV